MSVAEGDLPTWFMVVGGFVSIFIGSLTGAIGAAWNAGSRFQELERRIVDKFDATIETMRKRQDELHSENREEMRRLEDRIARRRP